MRLTRKNAIILSCIILAALALYLTRPIYASLEGTLSLGYFPLEQMTDPYGSTAITASGRPSFGRAYTVEAPRSDGGIRIIYLSNPAGRIFGNNTRPAGRILQGCEVGDTIRVRGLTYYRIGPTPRSSWKPRAYRVMILQSVEKMNSN